MENPADVEITLVRTEPVTERAPFIPHAQGRISRRDSERAARQQGKGKPRHSPMGAMKTAARAAFTSSDAPSSYRSSQGRPKK